MRPHKNNAVSGFRTVLQVVPGAQPTGQVTEDKGTINGFGDAQIAHKTKPQRRGLVVSGIQRGPPVSRHVRRERRGQRVFVHPSC